MTDSIVNYLTGIFTGSVPDELIIFFISVLPILEWRGGLIAASILDVNAVQAIIICVIGNILPIPFILLFFNKVVGWMKERKICERFINWLENKSMSKSKKIETAEFWGLMIFVGIPLPGTGAWTGAVIAAMLGLRWKKSMLAISLGVLIAAAIMFIIAYVIPWIVTGKINGGLV